MSTSEGGNSRMPWLYNIAGGSLPDEDMRNIQWPRLELHTHVMFKTVQAGAFLGLVAVGPGLALAKGPRTLSNVWARAKRASWKGALIGIPLGPLMTEMTIRKSDEAGVYDRVYRIRYNKGQCNVDKMAAIGAATLGVCMPTFGMTPHMGAVLGVTSGMLTGAVMNHFNRKSQKASEETGKVE